jgi:site-specific DNA recombinase
MAGVKEKLLAGIWCTPPPVGYDIVRSNGKKSFVLNAKGKLIRKAFAWKLQGLNNEDIRVRLADLGWKIGHQRVADLLRNPFYCGLIVHTALEGQVIEGIQEKAVSKEVFLQVNNILAQTTQGYSLQIENEDVPLKRFLRCDTCGQLMRAYVSKKINKYYYKCPTKGCACNKRADELHERFKKILEGFTLHVNESTAEIIARKMKVRYYEANKEKAEAVKGMEREIVDIEKKISRLEERYIMEEIDREMFLRFKEKFSAERAEVVRRISGTSLGVSNLEKAIEKAISYALKLAPVWDLSDYAEKQIIQNMLFPEGISYNRKTDECRTLRINSIFAYMAELARVSRNEKTGNVTSDCLVAGSVVWAGIEPATHGFSVHCSTN